MDEVGNNMSTCTTWGWEAARKWAQGIGNGYSLGAVMLTQLVVHLRSDVTSCLCIGFSQVERGQQSRSLGRNCSVSSRQWVRALAVYDKAMQRTHVFVVFTCLIGYQAGFCQNLLVPSFIFWTSSIYVRFLMDIQGMDDDDACRLSDREV